MFNRPCNVLWKAKYNYDEHSKSGTQMVLSCSTKSALMHKQKVRRLKIRLTRVKPLFDAESCQSKKSSFFAGVTFSKTETSSRYDADVKTWNGSLLSIPACILAAVGHGMNTRLGGLKESGKRMKCPSRIRDVRKLHITHQIW